MRVWIAALPMIFATGATSATEVAIQSTYQATWDAVAQNSDCQKAEYPDLTLFTCEADKTLWYFTKPNNAAHPGVVKRQVVQDPSGSVSVDENGVSFGSDAAQPAFKAWMDSIVALDAKVKEDMARRAGDGQKQ
jgi:hypothetical protein